LAEPENVVLRYLGEMREDMRRTDSKIDGLGADFRSEMHSLRAGVASDLMSMEKRMNDQFVALRRSVMEHHSTAVG
jgi:hypothetical protein